MNIAPFVAQHVEEVVHGNWTDIYLDDTIADVTYEEAVMLPPGITNSIAMLVNHLKFYNNVVAGRLAGENPAIDSANGFNVAVQSEEEWQKLKQDALDSFKMLAGTVRELPDEKLLTLSPGQHSTFYKTLHGIAEHAHYHLGQIVLLKKIMRFEK
ncbi:MAG TPA: DinB family protein [Chitinophagaceae bacterium]|nr:DinB family protein [Chitinophagaceae bacterium]